ncbi:hypothetical protein CFC21_102736 [Triticum aestivum]|uniref:Uncharacterized protein n=2 Tax=Triticum aestivum TaxID=4565 RepID=A0A3B6U0X7_WHEAT|nr:hypothetical protein CFC21_102736 [Triticum aestivum]
MEVERPVSMMPGLADGFFTEADLAAADQLVQLSVSGGAEVTSPTSSSRSVQSVNNTEAAARKGGCDDGAPWLDRRARKRYRRVAELYHATRPLKRADAGGKRRREEIPGIDRKEGSDRSAHWANCAFV